MHDFEVLLKWILAAVAVFIFVLFIIEVARRMF